MQRKVSNGLNLNDIKNYVKKEFKLAEMDYINKKIKGGFENNNTKSFWGYVRAKNRTTLE